MGGFTMRFAVVAMFAGSLGCAGAPITERCVAASGIKTVGADVGCRDVEGAVRAQVVAKSQAEQDRFNVALQATLATFASPDFQERVRERPLWLTRAKPCDPVGRTER